ncbi:MAG: hypothetical protein C0P72_010660, partial [Clostridia bacterium]
SIKIRKNSFHAPNSESFFHVPPRPPFAFYSSKKAVSFCGGTCTPSHFPEGAPRRGKTPLRGPPSQVYVKGFSTAKDYVFFCGINRSLMQC